MSLTARRYPLWRQALRIVWRLPLLFFAVGLCLLLSIFYFSWCPIAHQRRAMRALCALMVWAVGARVTYRSVDHNGHLQQAGLAKSALPRLHNQALIVSNHASWLDILVLGQTWAVAFVAKSELARWPILGFIFKRCHAVFIDRERRHAVLQMNQQLIQAAHKLPVTFFPEGKIMPLGQVGTYKSSLFEFALQAQLVIQPIVLYYHDGTGALQETVEHHQQALWRSLWRSIAHPLSATVTLLPQHTARAPSSAMPESAQALSALRQYEKSARQQLAQTIEVATRRQIEHLQINP